MNDNGCCLPDVQAQRRTRSRRAVLIIVLYGVALLYAPALWMLQLPAEAVAAAAPAVIVLTGQMCRRLWLRAQPRRAAAATA